MSATFVFLVYDGIHTAIQRHEVCAVIFLGCRPLPGVYPDFSNSTGTIILALVLHPATLKSYVQHVWAEIRHGLSYLHRTVSARYSMSLCFHSPVLAPSIVTREQSRT